MQVHMKGRVHIPPFSRNTRKLSKVERHQPLAGQSRRIQSPVVFFHLVLSRCPALRLLVYESLGLTQSQTSCGSRCFVSDISPVIGSIIFL